MTPGRRPPSSGPPGRPELPRPLGLGQRGLLGLLGLELLGLLLGASGFLGRPQRRPQESQEPQESPRKRLVGLANRA